MKKYTIYAEAWGTFYTEVEARNPSEALVKAGESYAWKLMDEPEVGTIVEIDDGERSLSVKDDIVIYPGDE